MRLPDSYDFKIELYKIFKDSQEGENPYLDVNAGDLHRKMGGDPGKNHRMPLCCDVMKKNMKTGDKILEQPPKGKGASLTIRYRLPR